MTFLRACLALRRAVSATLRPAIDEPFQSRQIDGPARAHGNPNADTQAYTKTDDRHWTVTSKKGGKVTLTSRIELAADGKSRTTTQTGTDAQGRTVNNVIVYDKQ